MVLKHILFLPSINIVHLILSPLKIHLYNCKMLFKFDPKAIKLILNMPEGVISLVDTHMACIYAHNCNASLSPSLQPDDDFTV